MTSTALPDTSARNATLDQLVGLLQQQSDVKYDAVVSSRDLSFDPFARLAIEGGAAVVDDEGVATTDAMLSPTEVFDEGVSARLGIPRQYLRRMRAEQPSLLADNVNTWLAAEPDRRHLVRGFRTDDAEQVGVARAFLSDRYRPVDNLDVLLAALDGVRATGTEVRIAGADLSERAMRVKVEAPGVLVHAERLLANYRSPFTRQQGTDLPVVFAGFVISNSETGGGAFQIVPRIVVEVCKNGMTMGHDAMRQVHLGGRLDDGVIRWSDDTWRRNAELVTAQARDAVSTFLDVDYVRAQVERIEALSGAPVVDAPAAIERLAKKHLFTGDEQSSILGHFIAGADTTAGGMMQAVTATAQTVADPDRSAELEDAALGVLADTAAMASA